MRRIALVAIAAAVLEHAARAQGSRVPAAPSLPNVSPSVTDVPVTDAERARAESVLRGRHRGTMHPGNPLELVGVREGDPKLCEGTPVLQNATHEARTTADEELRARAIAMVEDRASFTRPPAFAATGGAGRPAKTGARSPVAKSAQASAPMPEQRSSSAWLWISVAVAVVPLVMILRRLRASEGSL